LKWPTLLKDYKTNMPVGIEMIEYFLPVRSITSEELAVNFGFDPSFIKEKIGVKKLYIAGDDENTSDLAVRAVEKIFIKKPELKDKIRVIAVCTQTPDYQLPHTSAIVQKKLGLGNGIACFDLGLGCSGFVYGLSVVRAFMEDNNLDYGLLITAETYSKIIDDKDKNTKALFSDASAATLLSREPYLIPQQFTFGTDGNGYDSLILRPTSSQKSNYLYMDGRGIFGFVASVIPEDLKKCLQINTMRLEDIDYFIFHQASNFMLDTLSKKIGITDEGRVIKCLDRFGNTVSSSIPIAIDTISDDCKNQRLKILISGFGVGLSWASTILFTK